MNMVGATALRRATGPVLLVLVALTLLGCNVRVGMDVTSTGPLEGRTPATFAAACVDLGGTVIEVEAEPLYVEGVTSSCTMANGDSMACDWVGKLCKVACVSTPESCDTLQRMAYVPIMLREATPSADSTPALSEIEPSVIEPSAGLHS